MVNERNFWTYAFVIKETHENLKSSTFCWLDFKVYEYAVHASFIVL